VLDIAVIIFGYYAVKKLSQQMSAINIIFSLIVLFAFIVAIFVTKEVFNNGVKFDSNEVEFTGLDDNNIFEYSNIEKVESSKDTAASMKKNFVDRYSSIIIYLNDNSVVTIELGLTTKKTLKKITDEINSRI
jgi:hypothetical protein